MLLRSDDIIEIKLFDDCERIDTRPLNSNENIYDYLNYSGRKKVAKVRKYLESCLELYPHDEKEEIKNRLKTKENFESTFFEIYLYKIFQDYEFTIESHPNMEDTENKPDFLLSKKDIKIYLEAKVDYNKSFKERSYDNKVKEIKDNINKLYLDRYRISLEKLEIKSKKQPSLKGFKNSIINIVNKLDYKNDINNIDKDISKLESYSYEDNSLFIKYKLYAVPKKYKDKRLMQIDGSNKAIWINCSRSIRKSLESKSSRYGKMEEPFIIALNSLDFFTDDDEVRSAVLGDMKNKVFINKETNESILGYRYHESNGFFSYNNTKK